jgi:hypothetical protein
VVDALLCELECGEENGVDDAGTRHGHAESSVHAGVQELDLGSGGLVSASDKAVALVDALRGVDGEYLQSSQYRYCACHSRCHSRMPN